MDFFDLKKLGIVMKRAQYFITCKGKYYGTVAFDDMRIRKALTPKIDLNFIDEDVEQLSFFDNKVSNLAISKGSLNNKLFLLSDKSTSVTGEL